MITALQFILNLIMILILFAKVYFRKLSDKILARCLLKQINEIHVWMQCCQNGFLVANIHYFLISI